MNNPLELARFKDWLGGSGVQGFRELGWVSDSVTQQSWRVVSSTGAPKSR